MYTVYGTRSRIFRFSCNFAIGPTWPVLSAHGASVSPQAHVSRTSSEFGPSLDGLRADPGEAPESIYLALDGYSLLCAIKSACSSSVPGLVLLMKQAVVLLLGFVSVSNCPRGILVHVSELLAATKCLAAAPESTLSANEFNLSYGR